MDHSLGTGARGIARAAIRQRLAEAAFQLFRSAGFDRVTINDVASEAGVSRSTFLRYFPTKEDAVLGALDSLGAELTEALRDRPAQEGDWTALRRAMEVFVEQSREHADTALALARLILDTPALQMRLLEKQASWRPGLAQALAERANSTVPAMQFRIRAAASLDCLTAAVDEWTAADGRRDLGGLLDDAFTALTQG